MDRQAAHSDIWAIGDRYETYVGRWSRRVADAFVDWLGVAAGMRWLDVGCGTGALTQTVLDRCRPRSVTGVDSSPGFIEHARSRVADERASFAVADAQALDIDAESIDSAVSGLCLNFIPQPLRAVAEMVRVVRPGGVVAAYVWDYAGRMDMIRRFWDAAVALDPAALALDEARRFPTCAPAPLADLFGQAGLSGVAVSAIDIATDFRDFDDYWRPFLGGQGPAPAYAMSLDEARRDALRDRIRSTLPADADGAIRLTARAWAVRGGRR